MPNLAFSASLKNIQELTDYNDHTQAYIEGSKLIGNEKLAKKFELFSQIRDLDGGLDSSSSVFQNALYNQMMDHAQTVLDDDQFTQFYGSF